MSLGIVQSSGTEINPGDWVHITFGDGVEYVGRFSGVYENPSFGWMYRLTFARPVDGSKPHDTLVCPLREGNGCEDALDTAVVIQKPTIRSGKPIIKTLVPPGATVH